MGYSLRLSSLYSFSPVAGIQWVETQPQEKDREFLWVGFSPVAGIQWVETFEPNQMRRVSLVVSVPLPGFSGLRHRW